MGNSATHPHGGQYFLTHLPHWKFHFRQIFVQVSSSAPFWDNSPLTSPRTCPYFFVIIRTAYNGLGKLLRDLAGKCFGNISSAIYFEGVQNRRVVYISSFAGGVAGWMGFMSNASSCKEIFEDKLCNKIRNTYITCMVTPVKNMNTNSSHKLYWLFL